MVEFFKDERGGSLLSVVLVVADEEGPCDVPELSITLLHDYNRRGKITCLTSSISFEPTLLFIIQIMNAPFADPNAKGRHCSH